MSESAPRFAALISDLVQSREIPERAAFQMRLKTELDRLNGRLARDLAAPLTLLRGDEIQSLFVRPQAAVTVITELDEALSPHRLTHGLGFGELSTERARSPLEMDGPCFHRARAAWTDARGAGRWVSVSGFGSPTDGTLDALFHLMQAVRGRWTERQREIVHRARGARQKDVAAALGVNPSVVSESLKAAAFSAILDGERAVVEILSGFAPGPETQEAAG